jgi:hypothetical protein
MLYLTLILMFSAIVQAGVIKVPALLEFKAWFWQDTTKATIKKDGAEAGRDTEATRPSSLRE